jgi:DNA-binding transcriptional regulator YiaG
MIRTETEYQEALRRLQQDRQATEEQRVGLVVAGLTPEEVERGLEPLYAFHAQLAEEVEWYERACRGEIPEIHNLEHLGRQLIALRLARGMSQRELAQRLAVSEAVVSRDEHNEYHGITAARAQRVIEALDGALTARVEEPTGLPARPRRQMLRSGA